MEFKHDNVTLVIDDEAIAAVEEALREVVRWAPTIVVLAEHCCRALDAVDKQCPEDFHPDCYTDLWNHLASLSSVLSGATNGGGDKVFAARWRERILTG